MKWINSRLGPAWRLIVPATWRRLEHLCLVSSPGCIQNADCSWNLYQTSEFITVQFSLTQPVMTSAQVTRFFTVVQHEGPVFQVLIASLLPFEISRAWSFQSAFPEDSHELHITALKGLSSLQVQSLPNFPTTIPCETHMLRSFYSSDITYQYQCLLLVSLVGITTQYTTETTQWRKDWLWLMLQEILSIMWEGKVGESDPCLWAGSLIQSSGSGTRVLRADPEGDSTGLQHLLVRPQCQRF